MAGGEDPRPDDPAPEGGGPSGGGDPELPEAGFGGGRLLRAAPIVYTLMTLAGALWAALNEHAPHRWPEFEEPLVWPGIAIGIAAGVAVAGLSALAGRISRGMRRLARLLRMVTGRLTVGECLLLAGFSGLGEEVLFRGAMQPAFERALGDPVGALIVTSALFAAVHVSPVRPRWSWPAFAFVVGVAMGALYRWTGALEGPVLMHVTVNFIGLLRLRNVQPLDPRDLLEEVRRRSDGD